MGRAIDAGELEKKFGYGPNDTEEERAFNQSARKIIREMPTLTPPNEPLTIEQLREMNGEPVWIVDIKGRKWYPPGWAIVDRENCLVRLVKSWNPIFFEKYGEWWIAYRRPLEGEV